MKSPKVMNLSWHSGDVTIQRSIQHEGLFIVNHADGTWHSVTSSYTMMMEKYPEN